MTTQNFNDNSLYTSLHNTSGDLTIGKPINQSLNTSLLSPKSKKKTENIYPL